ncbi:zinc finger protein 414 isoform X1 [Anguilla anguilla]|uniref:zinc finger protein 414 isoform X1 n=2 Tax=Anguilla anguilla TaxID=7936 RepID=UPI0015ADB0EC|nr:zinc finger protein 414 isoform X1 [Anguilla anguilla]
MSELQRLLSTGSPLPVDSSVAGMSAGIAECNPTPQPLASTNTQGTILPCSFRGCKQTFSNMQQLSSHVESHKIPKQSLPGKAFRCSALGCSGTFPSMQHLMEHMRHHYKPNHYFLCESCRAKLRSYRALFKHLHTCAKVAKSKAAREEITSPGAMTMTETAETALAYEAAAPAGTSASIQTPMKEEPMELEPAPTAAESGISNRAPPLASLQATVNRLPQEAPLAPPTPVSPTSPPAPATPPALPPGPFSLMETAAFTAEPLQPGPPPGSIIPSATPPSPLPYSPLASSSPPTPAAPGQRPGRPVAPASPAPPTPPGSNAVWKKNQGQSFSSRILWEHTRGRYSCLQCGHSTPTRQEMTAHIEGQHRSPAGRAQTDPDNRGSPPFQPKISLETETAVYTQL